MKTLTPKYPGDAVAIVYFRRGNEIGDVRIQWYSAESYRIATFLPGRDVMNPGDTPKVEPDASVWCSGREDADRAFRVYLTMAGIEGWQEAVPS